MPQYNAPVRDFQFLIRDFLPMQAYKNMQGMQEAMELVDPILEGAAQLCEEVLFPLNQSGDQEGLKFDKGSVITPKGFKEAYKTYIEGGWSGLTCDPAYGGQGMPEWLNLPLMEMVCSANLSFGLTPGLSHGAYNALLLHGSDELKKKYLPKLVSGVWSGVMCLTEPQAGTDLGLVKTRAELHSDGSYSITGTKIFISSGEQDVTENILHLILAKLPGAPAGTKGISLFIAPKFLVKEDGNLGERNKFACGAIEHKMGIHASPTCVMNFDGAKAWLVGAPNKGMKAMFTMMNAARLYVGLQGLGIAEVAYQNALSYAKERLQGRAITGAKFPDKAADPLTVHADIKRMLLTMKSFTEGARALAIYTALQSDVAKRHEDAKTREAADDWVQLMTPIVKAHLTDGGFETANLALQVFGGYGYIKEYGMEQYVRDARIPIIYEGTNGVQALDLIGRKLPFATGRYLRQFFHPVDAFINKHKSNEAMAEFTKPLAKHVEYLQQGTIWMAKSGLGNMDDAAAGATEYLKIFSLVALGFMWAQMAAVAQEKLRVTGGELREKEFYEAKLATARFYMKRILPQTISLLASVTAGSKTVMDPAAFTG